MDDVLINWNRSNFIVSLHAGHVDFMAYCYEVVSEHQLATRQLVKLFCEASIPVNDEILLQVTSKFLFFKTIDGIGGKYLSHSDSHILLFVGREVVPIKWENIEFLVA